MEQLTPEELARIQEKAREALEPFAKIQQQLITQLVEPIIKSQQEFFRRLGKRVLESQQQWAAQWVEQILRLQQPFLKIAKSLAEIKRIARAFQECDLWLAPSMVELTDKVVKLHNDGKKQVIPSIITRYYKRNNWAILKKTVSDWESNRFFRPRMRIISDALEAHMNGKYTLSVPSLLPHIEGIATEIVEKYNLPEIDKPLIYREDIYGEDGEKTYPSRVFAQLSISDLDFKKWVAMESLLYYLEGTMYLSPRKRKKKLKDFATKDILNRHSILHGAHVKYATSMNSLRCFLALDVLSLIDGKTGK